MNNDLISREALKELIEDKLDERYRWDFKLTVCEFKAILRDAIDNAPSVIDHSVELVQKSIELGRSVGRAEGAIGSKRPQGELKEYKPLKPDYNVQCAVENLKTAYWSNDTEKYAKAFTEAEEIIINAICHHGYIVLKRPRGEWIYKEFDVESGISHSYWCSNCGEPKSQWCDDFCQRCGADMRKGGTKE